MNKRKQNARRKRLAKAFITLAPWMEFNQAFDLGRKLANADFNMVFETDFVAWCEFNGDAIVARAKELKLI